MTGRPYTDDDLRAEAARQHAKFTAEPDEGLVGEVMESGNVLSLGERDDARTWTELLEPDGDETPEYTEAQRAVTDLIRGAADVSKWAINLGADGLEPDHHAITIGSKDSPIARIHFAFAPDLDDDLRNALVEGIGQFIADSL
ncbi:hypothetical protein [Streptomyces sp. BBFR109]|uniref:hypothetical protein n=1 Tax=Streptomyces sp. BBFR109 TaxID=3448172 RepID=UPI003F77418C